MLFKNKMLHPPSSPVRSVMKKIFFRFTFSFVCFSSMIFTSLSVSDTQFMSLDEVRPGMRGTCKTVFQGDSIEVLEVEIIGTIKNFLPKKDLILARLFGRKIEYTGLIAGMSGSPVYLEGKLIGAVAYGFTFAKEPIAGITPIEQMLEIGSGSGEGPVSGGAARPSGRASGRGSGEARLYNPLEAPPDPLLRQSDLLPRPDAGSFAAGGALPLSPLEVPLVFSGCHPEMVRRYGEIFSRFGLVPMMGGGGQGEPGSAGQTPFEAGSPVSAQLVRGDLSLASTGTMTYRDSSRILAFGHPFMMMGPVDFPMTGAEIITVMPSIQRSFKLSNSTGFMGAITNDHTNGIMGVIGSEPAMIPVNIKLEASGRPVETYNYEMIRHKMLTPLLGTLVMANSLISSGGAAPEQIIEFSGRLELKDTAPVVLEDMFAGLGAASASARNLQNVLLYLYNNSYGPAELERIDLKLRLREGNPRARISEVFLDRKTAHPGDSIHLEVHLDPYTQPMFSEKFTVTVPEDNFESGLYILVGSGDMVTRTEMQLSPNRFRYTSIEHLVRLINDSRKNNHLYLKVFRMDKGLIMGDQMFPGLPPSVWTLLKSDKTTGAVSPLADFTLAEFERPTGFIISGFKIIRINVKPRS